MNGAVDTGTAMKAKSDSMSVRELAIGIPDGHGALRAARRAAVKVIARNIDFSLARGESMVILGPNGAGKTTLLRTILGLLPAIAGSIEIGDVDIRRCSARQRAQLIAYVPQSQRFNFGFRVRDFVAMGRAPFLPTFALPSCDELQLADSALEQLGISHLADSLATDASGGEQRLMLIAQALVQDAPFLMLDEPTANLDYANQARVLRQLVRLCQSGLGIIMNSHSPGHAFACGTSAALLDRQGKFVVGSIPEMVTDETLSRVYGVAVRIVTVSTEDGPMQTCVPELRSR